jgi:hypothetical protein
MMHSAAVFFRALPIFSCESRRSRLGLSGLGAAFYRGRDLHG